MSFTREVSRPERSRDVSDVQPSNIPCVVGVETTPLKETERMDLA